MNFKNIAGNIGAIYIFAEATYPGLNGEMIVGSILNGTILTHIFELGLAYMAFQFGKETKVRYVTD